LNLRQDSSTWLLLGIVCLALVLRAGAAVWWHSRAPAGAGFFFADSESYWDLGNDLAAGRDYQYGPHDFRVFRMPGYPLLVAGVVSLTGPEMPHERKVFYVRLAGVVLGGASVAAVYVLGRVLCGTNVALIAAGIAAVYPEAIIASVFVLSEALFMPLMVVQLAAMAAAWGIVARRGYAMDALSGGLAGLATLTRPEWLIFLPGALLARRVIIHDRARSWFRDLAAVLALVVVMTPWWLRNYNATGYFVPTTLQLGASLYDGLNPQATGASNFAPVDAMASMERRWGKGAFEYRLNRLLRRQAIEYAQNRPAAAAKLSWAKFSRTWNVLPNEPALRSGPAMVVIAGTYVPVMLLALWGTWRPADIAPGGRRKLIVCWLPVLYIAALHLVFVGSLRYRGPAMLCLAVPAASAVAGLIWGSTNSNQNKDVRDSLSTG
jgi:4-amino-4-deoxy-L-arabinose transferase-like glycosyltransferase